MDRALDLGEPPLFRYHVYLNDVSDDIWSPIGGDSTSIRLRHLENGRTYRIRVTAENAEGEGRATATVTARPKGRTGRPSHRTA